MAEFIKIKDKSKSFETVAGQVTAESSLNFDEVLPKTHIFFKPTPQGHLGLNYVGLLDNIRLEGLGLQQICREIGIPFSYIQKCSTDLMVENINYWWDSQDRENSLYRFGQISDNTHYLRAFLSDKYSIFNNTDVIENLSTLIGTQFYVDSFVLTDKNFLLRLVDEKATVVGDTFVGIQIRNSEVGLSRLTVELFLYKLACTNGMTVPIEGIKFEHAHYGIKREDFLTGFNFVSSKTLSFKEDMARKIRILENQPIGMNRYMEDIKFLKDTFKEDEEVVTNIINTYVDKYDKNRWGFVNAITETAQMYSAGKRLILEQFAGNIFMAEAEQGV